MWESFTDPIYWVRVGTQQSKFQHQDVAQTANRIKYEMQTKVDKSFINLNELSRSRQTLDISSFLNLSSQHSSGMFLEIWCGAALCWAGDSNSWLICLFIFKCVQVTSWMRQFLTRYFWWKIYINYRQINLQSNNVDQYRSNP